MSSIRIKSVDNFSSKINETYRLIHSLEAQVLAMRVFSEKFNFKDAEGYADLKELLEVEEHHIEKLFELGFIALFANFECLTFELTKELLKRYPTSYKSEKIVKYEDIKDFDSLSDVKEYFIDAYAIEKSYDLDTWLKFLDSKFKIRPFKSARDVAKFKALNSMRNIIMHSGSVTNSRFRNEMKIFLKVSVPLGDKFNPDRKKYFEILYQTLKLVAKNIDLRT